MLDLIEHQRMQVNVRIGRRHKALDEGDGAGGGIAAFDTRLPDKMRRNDPVNDLQYRCEQFGVYGEWAAQRAGNDTTDCRIGTFGEDIISQPRNGVRQTPRPARWAIGALEEGSGAAVGNLARLGGASVVHVGALRFTL